MCSRARSRTSASAPPTTSKPTNLDSRKVEYLYSDNEGHVLMDLETYDQNTIPKEVFGDDILYLKPNTQLNAMFHDGKLVSYELPKTVDLKVTDTQPASKARPRPTS